ncbi:MAG: hypothetical protein ACP5PB_09830 [Acidimicrobiales bacterium]
MTEKTPYNQVLHTLLVEPTASVNDFLALAATSPRRRRRLNARRDAHRRHATTGGPRA